jgi:hypothetical protein
MEREGSVPASRRWLRPVRGWHIASSLAVIAAFSIALLLDDWSLALVFLMSAVVGVALLLIVIAARRGAFLTRVRGILARVGGIAAWKIWMVVGGICGFGLALLLGLAVVVGVVSNPAPAPPLKPVFKTYTVLVRHDASNPDAFTLDISVSTVDGGLVPLGSKLVTSASATGFLARQVVVPGPARYSAPVAGSATENLCDRGCPDMNLRFEDFPVDSVWEVQRGEIDGHRVSGDTELVTASIAGVDIGSDDIQFTYFPDPYNGWRPYLGPIPGASSLPGLLVVLVGTVMSSTWVLALAGLEGAIIQFAPRWLRRRRGSAEPTALHREPTSQAEPANPPPKSRPRGGRPHR